ncbi:Hypothetical protein CINCED_3A012805 [Cinara cedri]|uniref:Venom dipeptidyl peptidase 4 n=1 Tax=Cinara cedri TaxID=506608 RepID=A0A5E4MBW1_9HEMI|nr:Hypothetical protein CINCED_3A012805 [Cinara cedri]
METIFSSSGQYNTNASGEYDEKNIWEKCIWNIKHRPLAFLLILLLVITVIGALVYFTTDIFNKSKVVKYEPLEFQSLMSGSYEPNRFNGTWISDEEILMKDAQGNIVLYNVKNTNATVLAQNSTPNVEKCFQYDLSADKEYLLLAYYYRKVYRHSFIAHYDLIEIKTGIQFTLQTNGKPWDLQLAKWSPVGHNLAVVDHYNIYYLQNITDLIRVKLTSTGGTEFYNGIPDWVYEEEIFSSNSAMWFSQKGSWIAYATFNDTLVPTMQLPYYGFPITMKYQYTSIISIHYPKVGVANPAVQLFVQNVEESSTIGEKPIPVVPPTELNSESDDIILNTVIWSDDSNLFVMWMNRVQNESVLVHYSIGNTAQLKNSVSFNQPGGWLDFTQIPLVGDGHRLALIYPVKQSNDDYFKHLVIVEPDGKLTPVTKGQFEVIELLKWDVQSNYIYYLANVETNPEEQYLYRTLAVGQEQSIPICMSCKTNCKFHRAEMSAENNYYSLVCSGPNVPEVGIFKTTGEKILDWETNVELKEILTTVTLPRISFIDVPLGSDFKARVKLILPPSVDENSDVKYPMLVNTYAGPGSSLVTNKFSVEWNMYFSSNKNVIVAQIDGRGSGRRGDKNMFANYRKLGTYEIEDQIFVASYLQDRFSFIDKSKTAIWGWSYGGYTSGMVLAKDNKNVFKCGLSVAPVTDWIYYDTIYTERYMGLFPDNAVNYKNASLLTHAEKIRNKKYMLIHGTYDDNVHYQQSMMLSMELERRVILFRQQSYPDESHGLSSVRNHVYKTISSFLLDCFQNKI